MTIRVEQAKLLAQEENPLSALCNLVSLLYWNDNVNWAGLYLPGSSVLHLGPFMGKPACTSIPMGKGVVGTCAQTLSAQIVPDVFAFAGHIACDSASRSEICLPLIHENQFLGVLDMDFDVPQGWDDDFLEDLKKISVVLSGVLYRLTEVIIKDPASIF